MQLHKTDRARAELKPGVRTLGQRERTLLLMADGSKSAQDFRPLFDGDGEAIALRLLREGFLEAHPGKTAAAAPHRRPPPNPRPPSCKTSPAPKPRRPSRFRPTSLKASARSPPPACSCSISASACSPGATR
jgi:hypothetical protein